MLRPLHAPTVRARFPGLQRLVDGREAAFLDGPAGSQVPANVAAAVADHLLSTNANHGGPFATSVACDAMCDEARAAFADLFGPFAAAHEIVFGPNMTTLAFHLARALSRTWRPGDEIVVTDSDHDANVTPWVLCARERGVTVRRLPVRADTTLDLRTLASLLSPRTRLLAIGAASNLSGTVHDVTQAARMAHDHGALVFVDAVHHAAHARMDVARWGCDFAACSAYKFFGPHLGALWGKADLLSALQPDKVRPAPDHGPERWQTGTASFEAIAGGLAAVQYLATLGRECGGAGDRGALLDAAFVAIGAHERALCARLLDGIAAIPSLRVVGLGPDLIEERHATVSLRHAQLPSAHLGRALAAAGVFCWHGHSYALPLCESLGLLPDGVLRLGILHYNDERDVDRALQALAAACA